MIVGNTFAGIYRQLASSILLHGDIVSPRGEQTRELLCESFCLTDPTSNLAFIEGRKFNYMHALAEALLIFANTDSVDVYSVFNENMRQFSDDGEVLYGAYGRRVSESITDVISKLRSDNDTRQAVLTIHRINDVKAKSKDIPCTLSLHFMVRDRKLNMHVYMRSNDVVWGLPYDVFVFTNMQQVIANTLGLEYGKYFHTVSSLHAYQKHADLLKLIVENEGEAVQSHNASRYSEWKMLAHDFISSVLGDSVTKKKVELSVSFSSTMEMAAAIYIELAYRGVLHDKRTLAFIEQLKTELSMQEHSIGKFTKRWYKEE